MAQPRTDPKLDALSRGRLRTLLLYCPFDRKVTRHARRGNELRLVCLDCGRSVDHDPGEGESAATIELTPSPAIVPHGKSLETGSVEHMEPRSSPGLPTGLTSDHAMAQSRGMAIERRRLSGAAPESGRSATRRAGGQAVRATPRTILLAGAALLLALLGVANLLGQAVRWSAPVVPPPEVRLVTDASVPAVTVANTGGVGVYLRNTPNMEDFLYPVSEGAELQIAGPDLWADGIHWLQVEDSNGARAWVPAGYTSLSP